MSKPMFAFLDYELSPSTQTMTRGGVAVHIRPKTLATLGYLLANRHRVVTKDDLLDSIWPAAEVQDQAVFQSISELRSIFKGHDCIETVRGQGYRWILPLTTDLRTPEPRSFWRAMALAACLVAILGSIVWRQSDTGPQSLTLVIGPVASLGTLPRNSDIAPSMDRMLTAQLRRMGWDAQRQQQGALPADALILHVDVASSDADTLLHYQLRDGVAEISGYVDSQTPMGAVRDLATELHGLLSLRATGSANDFSIGKLLVEAKKHIDHENYQLAEAYLTVVLAEQPNHPIAQMALAYSYQQMGRHRNALELGYAVHRASRRPINRVDRMMSAMLLSQLLTADSQYTESQQFAHEALDIATNINDLVIVAEAQEQLGEISLAKGQIGIGKEQLAVALRYYSSFCPTGKTRVAKRLLEIDSPVPPSI